MLSNFLCICAQYLSIKCYETEGGGEAEGGGKAEGGGQAEGGGEAAEKEGRRKRIT